MANAHESCRAEVAVKTVKRMLADNSGPTGSLNADGFQRALLFIYTNSPDPETKTWPAIVLFGRSIRDTIPIPLVKYCLHNTWQETITNRELALAKRHSRGSEKWSLHTRRLPLLKFGDHVYIQNLVGNCPRRWDQTRVVVEVRQFHQYAIRVDGSVSATLRNRHYRRKFTVSKGHRPGIKKNLPSNGHLLYHCALLNLSVTITLPWNRDQVLAWSLMKTRYLMCKRCDQFFACLQKVPSGSGGKYGCRYEYLSSINMMDYCVLCSCFMLLCMY